MSLLKKHSILALCLAISTASIGVPAQAKTHSEIDNRVSISAEFNASEEELTELLHVIDSIPEEVLMQGDEATREWIAQNTTKVSAGEQPRSNVVNDGVSTNANEAKCVASIIWLIGSTIIPAAKILRIKKLIQQLGGVRAAVAQLKKHNFSWPSTQRSGGALRSLGAELLGIAGVHEHCFS